MDRFNTDWQDVLKMHHEIKIMESIARTCETDKWAESSRKCYRDFAVLVAEYRTAILQENYDPRSFYPRFTKAQADFADALH